MTPRRSIIIDTDPGQDDAFAILLALARHDRFNVLGVTAVAGNIEVKHTAANARKILKLAKCEDIPVFTGASAPLVAPPIFADKIHGSAIMEGWDLPASNIPSREEFAPDWIIDTICTMPPQSVTICALGPLTNIALAIAKRPDLCSRIEQLVLMGGAQANGGNMSAVAEFNIFADPHAAACVFAASIAKVVVSLDVTAKLVVTPEWIRTVEEMGSELSDRLVGLLRFYANYAQLGQPRPLHDPAVIAWLLQPELFQSRRVNVEIETNPGLCYGQTVVDRNSVTGRKPNALWPTDVDVCGFYRLLSDALKALG